MFWIRSSSLQALEWSLSHRAESDVQLKGWGTCLDLEHGSVGSLGWKVGLWTRLGLKEKISKEEQMKEKVRRKRADSQKEAPWQPVFTFI